jgi:hypothetical protein
VRPCSAKAILQRLHPGQEKVMVCCSWLAVVATLVSLLLPALVLADDGIIALEGEGGEAWSFEKNLGGDLPDGGCDRVVIASPRATVEAWQAEGRFGAVVLLLEGDNEVRAICRLGEADRSVSEPQHWRVRLRDMPRPGFVSSPARAGSRWSPGPANRPPGAARRSLLTNGGASRAIRNRS